jgi:hypothetical protein
MIGLDTCFRLRQLIFFVKRSECFRSCSTTYCCTVVFVQKIIADEFNIHDPASGRVIKVKKPKYNVVIQDLTPLCGLP